MQCAVSLSGSSVESLPATVQGVVCCRWQLPHVTDCIHHTTSAWIQGQLGELVPGALADVILIDGDLLADIGLLARGGGSSIALVIKDGLLAKVIALPTATVAATAFCAVSLAAGTCVDILVLLLSCCSCPGAAHVLVMADRCRMQGC